MPFARSLCLRVFRKGFLIAATAIFALCASPVRADDWPQWLGPQRDGIWRETGILKKFPANGPKIRWRVPVGAGFSGPAVAQGRVYLTDRLIKPGASGQANPFDRGKIDGVERVLGLD